MNKNDLFDELYMNLKKEFDEEFVNDVRLLIKSKKFTKKNYLKILGDNFNE